MENFVTECVKNRYQTVNNFNLNLEIGNKQGENTSQDLSPHKNCNENQINERKKWKKKKMPATGIVQTNLTHSMKCKNVNLNEY